MRGEMRILDRVFHTCEDGGYMTKPTIQIVKGYGAATVHQSLTAHQDIAWAVLVHHADGVLDAYGRREGDRWQATDLCGDWQDCTARSHHAKLAWPGHKVAMVRVRRSRDRDDVWKVPPPCCASVPK